MCTRTPSAVMNIKERAKISAYIICFNEAKRIRSCLESLKWCDEIVVVDSGSTDDTIRICEEYTSKIHFREWSGYGDQKNYALEQCSNDWVINLDADEVVSDSLQKSIKEVLSSGPVTRNGYFVQRVVFFLGRWWTAGGWYPEYRLRLAKKSALKWSMDPVHEKAIVTGSTGKLKGDLHHYTYRNLEDQINRLNKYSTLSANQMLETSKWFALFPAIYVLIRPISRFIRFYFLKLGFIYGLAGFIVAVTDSYYVFLKYAKLWELKTVDSQSSSENPPVS